MLFNPAQAETQMLGPQPQTAMAPQTCLALFSGWLLVLFLIPSQGKSLDLQLD